MSELATAVRTALSGVIDPEIRRPITDLGMVESVSVDDAGVASVTVLLTIAGCPLSNTIESDVTAAVSAVEGVTGVNVALGTMSDEQRAELKKQLRGGREEREIPFSRPDSLTQVLLVASGKGGVGKSSVTVNLAMALAARGKSVGILDADIYGHSVPQMLGLMEAMPTSVDGMIMPVPTMGMRVISIGMLKESRDQVIAWRGPILDRALQQFLADVYWGDLDYLVVDLPPGTGDVALSLGQKLPNAEVIVVTTPQQASAEVAERAGTMASMLDQKVIGVVENMAYLEVACPHCGESHRVDVFGTGGGAEVAGTLSTRLGYEVPLLAEVPMDPALASGGDLGVPLVATAPERPAAAAIMALAGRLAARKRNLAGLKLGLTPVSQG
ncbi:Iron-sulfur cluster carrier protein [Propionicimonas sp. T2.31MG-18]|uniref:Mrp/NBP35 family ATP-binding protein n=1 Tax=Propionicimonas sp. T2.31MG-18 TaxID=3157620 RepID=UPI0035E5F322